MKDLAFDEQNLFYERFEVLLLVKTYIVSSGLEGHSRIYFGAVFILVRTTSFGLAGLGIRVSLHYDIATGPLKTARHQES